MALRAGVQHCVAASTSGRHCSDRLRHFAFPGCDRFVEPARLRNHSRLRHESVVPFASLTMDAAAARSPGDGMLTTANNISVSPLPRPQVDAVKQVRACLAPAVSVCMLPLNPSCDWNRHNLCLGLFRYNVFLYTCAFLFAFSRAGFQT